jgi:hypothetical protein
MANSTFANLKINFLRRAGMQYNASDSIRLQMAGNCINQALGIIQGEIKGHPFTLDINNTVTSTITTPYKTDLADTDIIEILQVSERVDPRKLVWIPYTTYMEYMADPTRFTGTPNLYWTAVQAVNVSGQNIWSLLFCPTPASAITIYYDYVKNLQFASDTTSADAAFSPLPSVYDEWIYSEAKPMLYEMTDPGNTAMIQRVAAQALEARNRYRTMIMAGANSYVQVQSYREKGPMIFKQVGTVTI